MANDPSVPLGEIQTIQFRLCDVVSIGVACPNENCERLEIAVRLDRPYLGKRCMACGQKLPRRLVERLRQCIAGDRAGAGINLFIRLPPGAKLVHPLLQPARGEA